MLDRGRCVDQNDLKAYDLTTESLKQRFDRWNMAAENRKSMALFC